MSKELTIFKQAIERSSHFLYIYDLISNNRKRSIRSDWARKFKKLMHWNGHTRVMRVDGKNSILIIRDAPEGLTLQRFNHEYSSELLRSSIVSSLAALDKYFHDKALNKSFTLLNGSEARIPKDLLKFQIPAISAFKAAKKLRENSASRPGNQLKKVLQEKIHTLTFQNVRGVDEAVKMMGIKDFWNKTSEAFEDEASVNDIRNKLDSFSKRRNQIVHEADLVRKISSRRFSLREIDRAYAENCCKFINQFVHACDTVIEQA